MAATLLNSAANSAIRFLYPCILMNSSSSLEQTASDCAEASPAMAEAGAHVSNPLIPALACPERGPSSPAEMAERDLQLTLQLLAERMQHLTGASAATIALDDGQELLCRASAGPMATEAGAPLRAEPSLMTQSISTQQIICCNDAENGVLADGTVYGSLGIRAMMVMPLLQQSQTVGMLELLADRTGAFDDNDGAALERLSEMVMTALEHAQAAKRAVNENTEPVSRNEPEVAVGAESPATSEDSPTAQGTLKLQSCEACGFPVSEGRTLCLDCEEARIAEAESGSVPAFLAQLEGDRQRSWLQSHFYTIGTVLMIVLTVVVLMLKLQ